MLDKIVKIMTSKSYSILSTSQKQLKFILFILLILGLKTLTYSQDIKGSLKTIKYKDKEYCAIGYVYDNQFVAGQKLTFLGFTDNKLKDTIVSGKYFCNDDGTSYIDGIWKIYNGNDNITVTKGIFNITNN